MKFPISLFAKTICLVVSTLVAISTSHAEDPFYPTYENQPQGNGHQGVHQPGQWDHYPSTYERLPDDKGWAYNSNFDKFITKVASQSWIKLEYLSWNVDDPGNVVLGNASDIPTADPTIPFAVFDRTSGNLFNGYVTTLDRVGLEMNNGIRGTIGIPTVVGDFEASVWYLQEHSQNISRTDAVNADFFGAYIIPTLLDGLPRNNAVALAFSDSLVANYQTQIMGTEFNFITASDRPGLGINFRPTMGAYYISLEEDVNIVGVDSHSAATTRTAGITSNADNDIFGAQFGVLAEFKHEWFTISAQPKVMFGFNRQEARVVTSNLFVGAGTSATDTDIFATEDSHNRFSPGVKLELKATVHLSKNFSIFAGYDLLYLASVTRPGDNIYWNDFVVDANSNAASTRVNLDHTAIMLQGVSAGGMLKF